MTAGRKATNLKPLLHPKKSKSEQAMANASKKHIGVGSQGKSDGSCAMSNDVALAENVVLSNRDKKQHSEERGQDATWIQTEQLRDHELNQNKD